jgi:hypothetical protein
MHKQPYGHRERKEVSACEKIHAAAPHGGNGKREPSAASTDHAERGGRGERRASNGIGEEEGGILASCE